MVVVSAHCSKCKLGLVFVGEKLGFLIGVLYIYIPR